MIGGGRYDGLIETLGGAPTPGVGWAAGIERLAMLIGAPKSARSDVIVVVEDDRVQEDGLMAVVRLRRSGIAAELIATGSSRKRFDKAVKLLPREILSLSHDGDRTVARSKLLDTQETDGSRVEEALAAVIWPGDTVTI